MWTIELAAPIGADEWRGRLITHKDDRGAEVSMRRRDLAPELIPSVPPNAVEAESEAL